MKLILKKSAILTIILAMLMSIMPASFVQAEELINLCATASLISADPSSGSSSTKAIHIFDGDKTTHFRSYTSKAEGVFVLDLGEKKTFNQVSVYKDSSLYEREFKLTVQVSDDNSTWTDAMVGEVIPKTENVELIYDIPKASGKYVKFHIHDIVLANGYSGFAVSEMSLYYIADTTPPVITLNGDEVVELELGEEFVEPGYSATDDVDGDLTESVVVSGDVVNTTVRGTYIIRYNVSDAEGNAAEEKIRTVHVGIDKIPPVITLEGSEVIDLNIGDEYIEPGYSAEDNVDGDLTENVVISGDIVDTQTKGTYIVRYNVSDESGNVAEEKIRTVYVGIDRNAPVITLKGSSQMEIELGELFVEPGYTATDDFDGDITANVIISGDNIDVETAGTYIINYNVSDEAGNAADTVIRTVRVVENLYGSNLCIGAQLVTGNNTGGESTYSANMFDGDNSTRYRSWQAENRTGEYILNFDEMKSFNEFVVVQAESAARYFTITIQTGESATGPWENVVEPIEVPGTAGESVTSYFNTVNAQYVRFYIDNVDPDYNVYNIAEIQLYMDKATHIINEDVSQIIIPAKTGVSLDLPLTGPYGSDIKWLSSNEKIMNSQGRLINRPTLADGEKKVVLTASFSYKKSTPQERKYEVTVVPQNPAESSSISGGNGVSALNDGDYESAYAITSGECVEFTLNKAQHLSYVELELAGENRLSSAEVEVWDGSAYVSVGTWQPMQRGNSNLLITFPRGTYEKLKVLFDGVGSTMATELVLGLSDQDAVDYLAEILSVTDEPLDKVTKDLILKTKGDYGQDVIWSSSNIAVILDNGTVIRGSNDTDVRITATLKKGGATPVSVYFDITVLKKKTNSSNSSSGAGGGGSIRVPAVETTKPTADSDQQTAEKMLGMLDSHWAYTYVKKLADLKIVSGNEHGDFEPEKAITRAEYIKILVTAFGLKGNDSVETFSDVATDSWYAQYINVARSNGIVTGDENNFVMPERQITRQDMAVMLGRAMEACGKSIAEKRDYAEFSDNQNISKYAEEYIRSLYCSGVIDGMGDGSFAPLSTATKAQAAKLVASML